LAQRFADDHPLVYDRLLDAIAGRPAAQIIWVIEGQVEQAYQDLLAAIG
jgi:hypothetical protein